MTAVRPALFAGPHARELASLCPPLPLSLSAPIRVRFAPSLTAYRGRLLSGMSQGVPVHAASYPKRNELVLDAALRENRGELQRVLLHELAHFLWYRLSNPVRWSYEALLGRERGRGEAGWSAERFRARCQPSHRASRARLWREYICESFCDTAAWWFSGEAAHPECTLTESQKKARRHWFAGRFALVPKRSHPPL